MDSYVKPNSHIALRLPSGLHKVLEIKPDTHISLGKFGTLPANDLLYRPYYNTYEILDDRPEGSSSLRIIPASELHAEALTDNELSSEPRDDDSLNDQDHPGSYARNNQTIVDDPLRQGLSTSEIEELKSSGGSSKDLIEKIMSSHANLGEKTAFSLAKYVLRKRQKYLKRFILLPLDVSLLTRWYLHERDAPKILELREELIGLINSWGNVQCGESAPPESISGRWLVVEDTAGMLVASLAERMGFLHPCEKECLQSVDNSKETDDELDVSSNETSSPSKKRRRYTSNEVSPDNSITVVHSATQPNLSMLAYFSYDPNTSSGNTSVRATDHPLHSHLKTLTWLQLFAPGDDISMPEPEYLSDVELSQRKSGRRGAYHRKRRRWERLRTIVDETRAGEFDGLITATNMDPLDLLHHLVPLLKGGAPVVMYHPNMETFVDVADAYAKPRKTAFLEAVEEGGVPLIPSDDFPVDPRLLLAPNIQTARAHEWQVLPGRTHPVMTARGGAEGYVFTATKVLPTDGSIGARGNFMKKRKQDVVVNGSIIGLEKSSV